MISRRNFLKRLGIGTAAIAGAGVLPYLPKPTGVVTTELPKTYLVNTMQPVIQNGMIAGEKIWAGDLVYMKPDGLVYRVTAYENSQAPIGVWLGGRNNEIISQGVIGISVSGVQ